MKQLAYLSGDRGIPVPGAKGASIHVQQLCAAFRAEGWSGRIWTERPQRDRLDGWPVVRLPAEPEVLDLGSCDLVYERYSLWHSGGAAAARRAGAPFILEINSPLPEEARLHRGLKDADQAVASARSLFRQADGLVCVSSAVADWAAELRGNRDGVWVVPNGVDPQKFRPGLGRHPSLPARPASLVAFCGSFRPWHGLEDLAEATLHLNRTQPVDLLALGDGPERGGLQLRLSDAGLEGRVHFPGAVPFDEVPGWIGGADVALVPYPASGDAYFSPLKLFEAMALGVPVVAAASGQIPQVIRHGETGLLYPPGDGAALAYCVEQLLGDREEAKKMGDRARAWILERGTWRHRLGEILQGLSTVRRSVRT